MSLEAAYQRLQAAVDRLEAALAVRGDQVNAERSRADALLQAAQTERANLTEINRAAIERLDQTIGRLRGLLAT